MSTAVKSKREERMTVHLEDGSASKAEESRYRKGLNGDKPGTWSFPEKQIPRFARNDRTD
jgi:hypothetical protein